MSKPKLKCEVCRDTGWYGDNGPGIKGNTEYHRCDQCNTKAKPSTDPEVQRVCGEMGIQGVCKDFPKCGKCTIQMSIGDLAFWMRNHSHNEGDDYPHYLWNMILIELCSGAGIRTTEATPEQWIKAACKAWNRK